MAPQSGFVVELPMPDGQYERFRVVEDQLMDRQPASIRTFAGQGIDDPTATARLDWTMWGFHAFILSAKYTVYIDPYAHGDSKNYLSYYKHDFDNQAKASQQARCEVGSFGQNRLNAPPADGPVLPRPDQLPAPARANGTQRRTYRIAVACTGEYATFHGGTVAGAQAAIATSINRNRGVYERELAVSFTLLNVPSIIYLNASTDPYTNTSGSTMLGENQQVIDDSVGNANYDVGHVFSTGGGGIAGLGVICRTGQKARGVTGSPSPINDPFDIDYVAHEVGHQFGGNHTFNGSSGNCAGGNRSAANAYEPGSGTTIMAYAGICAPQNIQPNSDPYFHTRSYDEILNYTINGFGNTCPVVAATGNTPPTVTVPASNFTIPVGTPFVLTGGGADANGDAITFCWEQFNLGPAGPPNDPEGGAPIFRSFNPTASPSRTFPKIQDIVGNTQVLGEILPSYARRLTFRLTVRDNRSGGGGVNYDTVGFNVTDQAGPFVVSAPNTATSWPINSTQAVAWDVANTNAAPVNCANVRILLSTDGGLTYPTILVASTPNDGSENVTVPNVGVSTTARIRVEAVGNIFFDISNANFSIVGALPAPTITSFTPTSGPVGTSVVITGTNFTGATAVSFNNVAATTFTVNSATQITATVPTGATTGAVRVTAPGGTATSATNFSVSPTITSFTPASGPIGTVVTITGTNFTGATVVSFNSVNATVFTVNSATQITATVPTGATTGVVGVTTPAGTATSSTNFTVVPAPTITSFTPVSGPIGTVVTITGTNFTGATVVSFNNVNAATFTVNSATQVTATVPTGATTGAVRVTTPGGTAMSSANFTVLMLPTITSFTPTSGLPGTAVVITGTNFTGATAVTFNNLGAANFVVNSSTQITATVPTGATTGLIRVTTPAGTAVSATNFLVLPPCSLTPTGLVGVSFDPGTRILTKTAASGWNNATARSTEVLAANTDGWVEWEIPAITPTFYMAGLADAASGGNWSNVDYGIYFANGQIYVYNTTTGIQFSGRIAQAGDKLRVWKIGNRVNFYHNGTALMPFYQYPVDPATPLFFDVSFFSNGASLGNPGSSFCLTAPTTCTLAWANIAGATFNAPNSTLTKTSATGWGNAGAVSAVSLAANADGGIAWTIPTGPLDPTFYMLGLSATSPDNSWPSVQYGLYYAAGQLYVYLSGAGQGYYGDVLPGDQLSVRRSGNAINFFRNNQSFFGASVPANTSLIADLAMFSSGARVQGLQGINMCTGAREPLTARVEEVPLVKVGLSVEVYPNPTSGRFTLRTQGSGSQLKLQVLDLLGRLVSEQGAEVGLTELDLSSQPAGTYFVRVASEGFGQTVKIVKQ
jgi:Metallo-peptidase family M12/Secretion system C-terminal sorting domain/IPT/TIG domain